MFILRRLRRIIRPFSILKKYQLTLTCMLLVVVLYFALKVPMRMNCQIKCFDDDCHWLVRLVCPKQERERTEGVGSTVPSPTHGTRQNFMEYLLSNSEQSDQEDNRLAFPAEGRGHHEGPPVRFPIEKLRRPGWIAHPKSETNVVTESSRQSVELLPSSLNNRTGTVLSDIDTDDVNNVTGTMRLDNETDGVWEGNDTDSYGISVEIYIEDEIKKCAKQDQEVDGSNVSENNTEQDDHLHDNVTNSQKFCPCIPPNLVGRLSPIQSSEFLLENLWELEHRDVEPGGEWQPSHCRSRTRLALVVPYRDRLDHLKIFLRHMLPILKRQLTHFRIFIVEQNEPTIFNKAAMMNIGFLEAMKQFQFDCVIFHDVDILMEDDRSLLNCGDTPHHYAISLDAWNYTLMYGLLFGGVISLRPEMFNQSNGFSNSFFGWGGEDDDMGERVRRHWEVYRPPMEFGRYTAIIHTRDTANAENEDRHKILKKQMTRLSEEGLNSIRYKVEKIEKLPLFTWILANLDVSRLPYPTHNSSTYTLTKGVCTDAQAISAPRQRSRLTCQYDCDNKETSCVGFNHRVDGFIRECWLITGNCSSFEVLTNQPASLQTYLKKRKPVKSVGRKRKLKSKTYVTIGRQRKLKSKTYVTIGRQRKLKSKTYVTSQTSESQTINKS